MRTTAGGGDRVDVAAANGGEGAGVYTYMIGHVVQYIWVHKPMEV